MLNEVIDDLLALAMGNPEDMAGLDVDDVGGIVVASVKLELVDAEALCLPLGLDESAVNGVHILQTLQVDRFDRVLAKASNLSDLLEGVGSDGEKVPCVLQKCLRDPMAVSLKGHLLDPGGPAAWAQELLLVEFKGTIILPEIQVPKTARERVVDMH